jgi:iron complex transport system ATP-binding protein
MSDAIPGVALRIDAEAVVVTADAPLTVLSSAVVGGGLAKARALVNLRVPRRFPCEAPEAVLADLVQRRGLPQPYVGFLTAARTELAEVAREEARGIRALAVVTVGLDNPVAAGRSSVAAAAPSTINTLVVVDADPSPAALVNAALTVTEVKTAVLAACGVVCEDGHPASGTSTDAVAVAATGRGVPCRYGGPVSDLGWVVARAARAALEAGIRKWAGDNP